MKTQRFPSLDSETVSDTRDALHAYAGILGGWMSTCRAPRRHWWQASLRPSLTGATTGVVFAGDVSFEIDLELRTGVLSVRTSTGGHMSVPVSGQPAAGPAARIRDFLVTAGIPDEQATAAVNANPINPETAFPEYSSQDARTMATVLERVTESLVAFRSGIRGETGPIALWPHHFDLAMLWLPGAKVADADPDDEEYADKQMNFGFTFGDKTIPEPYFYVTIYPLPEPFPTQALPDGTEWRTDGFRGAVLTYRRLVQEPDPGAYLLGLWKGLAADGTPHLVSHQIQGS